MDKFRRKPSVIEAEQWFHSGNPEEQPSGVKWDSEMGRYYVVTIHGQRAYLASGDWILPEPDGIHFYPCKPDIFEATYESFDESDDQHIQVYPDGDMWCALRGPDLQSGESCFGETPLEALDGWLKLYGPNGAALKG